MSSAPSHDFSHLRERYQRLLQRLGHKPAWGERKSAEYDALLRRYPFRDRGLFG